MEESEVPAFVPVGRVSLTACHLIDTAAITVGGLAGRSILRGMVRALEWDVSGGYVWVELKSANKDGDRFVVLPLSNCKNLTFSGPELEPSEEDADAAEQRAEAQYLAELAEAQRAANETNAALARLRSQGKVVDAPGLPAVAMPIPINRPRIDLSTKAGRLAALRAKDRPIGAGQVPIDAAAQRAIEILASGAPAENPAPPPRHTPKPDKRTKEYKAIKAAETAEKV